AGRRARSSSTTSSSRSCRSRTTSRESSRLSGSRAWILAGLVLAATPGAARAQVFLATRPHPDFTIGPLFVRATVTPALGTTAVDVLWSLVIPPTKSATDLEQDLYLLWPDEVDTLRVEGKPDPDLARYVEARGSSVIGAGPVPHRAADGAAAHPRRCALRIVRAPGRPAGAHLTRHVRANPVDAPPRQPDVARTPRDGPAAARPAQAGHVGREPLLGPPL